MSTKKAKLLIFSVGAIGYGLLEILWRGYTHWSMLIAGGICFSAFSHIGNKMKKTTILIKGITGGLFITFIEFLFGVIFNIILKLKVWDYSKLPFNIAGQVCLLYTVIWSLISMLCIPFASFLSDKIVSKKE